MGRTPCCEKVGLKKGPWTPEEDQKLLAFIDAHGHGSWRALPSKAGLQRCGKSCRLRWTNYLRPDIKRGKFNMQEEQTIIQLHALLGNRWSAIATHLPKRTDNEIKNYWNTHIKKRLTKMGIDPITHKRRTTILVSGGQAKNVANLSHMAQWENARLEAEARLVREAKLVANTNSIQQQQQQNSSAQLVCRPSSTHDHPPPLMRPRPHCLDVLKAWQGIMWDKAFHGSTSSTSTLESPTSTLNFSSENFPIVPAVGFIPNQTMPLQMINYDHFQGMIMKQNESRILEPLIEEKRTDQNSIELHHGMVYTNDIYPINCIMESLTDLVDSANGHNLTESSTVDFEENNWNNIMNNLANTSPLGSPVF